MSVHFNIPELAAHGEIVHKLWANQSAHNNLARSIFFINLIYVRIALLHYGIAIKILTQGIMVVWRGQKDNTNSLKIVLKTV